MSNNGGFFGNIQHSFNSFIYSLTTEDRYASFDSPYRNNSNRPAGAVGLSNNNSAVSLVDNTTGSNRSSTSVNRPFQYRPGLRSQLQNNASGDLQLQDYINGQPPLPSIESLWERLETVLEREVPEVFDTLGDGATVADLNELENDLEISLPSDIRESYQIHDGQEGTTESGLFFGLSLLDQEHLSEEAAVWKKVCQRLEKQQAKKSMEVEQGSPSSSTSSQKQVPLGRRPVDFMARQKSVPEGAIQPVYAHPQWIPLAKDFYGNNIAVDMAPGPNGRWGQIILFGRDFDTKYVVANSWNEFLLSVVEDYEDGKFIVDPGTENLAFYENGKAVDYLRVLVHRSWALNKQQQDKTSKTPADEAITATTALRSNNNSRLDLPRETLITPSHSSSDLHQQKTQEVTEDDIKLEDDEEEEEEEQAAQAQAPPATTDDQELVEKAQQEATEATEDLEQQVEDVKTELQEVSL